MEAEFDNKLKIYLGKVKDRLKELDLKFNAVSKKCYENMQAIFPKMKVLENLKI
jgi:hypothetical protein